MGSAKDNLLRLAEIYGQHEIITHWAVSVRITGKGDFFWRLMDGGDCRTATAERVIRTFSNRWPDPDLGWPADIPRPPKTKQEAER